MQHKLQISYDVDEKEIQRRIIDSARMTINRHIDWLFDPGQGTGRPGIGFSSVVEVIDRKLCEEDTVKAIEQIVADSWERILREATLTALQHRANKLAFTAAKGRS